MPGKMWDEITYSGVPNKYRIITYISSPALVCNIGEGIDINVLMLYVFCL